MPGRVADFDCFYFTDSHVGWAANAKGEIWHTSDGGENWSIIGILHLRSITFTPFQLFFVDRLSGWLVGLWSVYHTIDGGITWQIEEPSGIKSIPRWSPHKCYFIDKKRGWVAASEGKVFETKDGGKKWNLVLNIDSGQDEDLYTMLIGRPDFRDILFLNGQTGWIIGNPNGGIFGTGDGGRSWKLLLQQVNDANQIVTSISFVDNREGWAVGNKSALTRIKPPFESKGVVLHTSDGGVKWDLVQVGRDEEVFQRVNFSSIADGWVVGKNRVYRTKDKGKRWNLVLDL